MKPLNNLNNVERAKLLFELFPDEMPGLMECIKVIAGTIISNPDKLKRQWNGQILTADFWLQLSTDASKRIEKNKKKLLKNSRRFSDQLFDGYNALFAVHCLQEYGKTDECNVPFKHAIVMLFP